MVDTGDLKSPDCKIVRVQVPSLVSLKLGFDTISDLFFGAVKLSLSDNLRVNFSAYF